MYKTVILPAAKKDVTSAALWYNRQLAGLGKKFIFEVRQKLNFIKQNPKATNIRYNNVRTANLNIFPYMIHYIIDDKKHTIVVLAVFHTSRNPKEWEKRKKHLP
jgi:plasmid stabilization system protein ParE